MTSPKIPLYKPLRELRPLEEVKALPLLGSRISIFYKAAGGERSIETTIGEVYKKIQKALSAEFVSPKLVIKGSSVASLFSLEPAEDVDMHYVADLTHLPEDDRIRKGYSLKWIVLRSIAQLIKEKLPALEQSTVIQTEDILFTEKHCMLSTRTAAPFNVHSISFNGTPVELTLFSITKTVELSERGFDFNSGSLELYLDPERGIFLGSYLPDMDQTLSQIERRELTCENPQDIIRKGLSRYMAKLVISGYYDKDISLFTVLLESEIKKYKGLEQEAVAKSVVETIAAHFREKNISPRFAYLFLWLMKGDTPLIKLLSKQAKEALLLQIATETSPAIIALSRFIAANKKAESSWFLLMQAKTLRKVIQRGEESLQMEIPLTAIFSGRHHLESIYITVPLEGVKMLTELSFAEGFTSLQNEENLIDVRGEDTKVSIQELLGETLSKPSLFPAFLTAMQKFSLKRDDAFFSRFLNWFEGLPEEARQTIPLYSLKNFIEFIPDNYILRQSTSLSLIRFINKEKRTSSINIAPRNVLTSIIFQLLKWDKFESLGEDDKEIVKAYGKELSLDFLQNRQEPIKEIEGEFKKIAAIIYILYLKGYVDFSLALRGAEGCLEISSIPQTFKFLQAVFTNETDLDQPVLLGCFLRLASMHTLEFTKFIIQTSSILQDKMRSFNQVIDSLFVQLDGNMASNELWDLFLELLDNKGLEDLKSLYKDEAIKNAILGNKKYETLFNKMKKAWGISSLDFISMQRIDAPGLMFLYEQADFRKRFDEDPLFTKEIGFKAVSLGLDQIAMKAAIDLACENPKCSLEVLEGYLEGKELSKPALFQSLRILGKILEHTPSLIYIDRFSSFIQKRLGVLTIFLSEISSSSIKQLDDPSLEIIQYFHSLVVFDTIENPCWNILWHLIRGNKYPVRNWINSKDIGEKLSQINPKENIRCFLQTFTLDAPFLVEFVRGMKSISPSEIDKYQPLLFSIFAMAKNSLLINPPKIDTSTHEPAQFLFELLKSFYTKTEVSSTDLIFFEIALFGLKFCTLFGDQSLRAKTLVTMLSLLKNTGPELQGYIKNSAHPKSLFFLCMDRALDEKNLEELHGLTEVHNTWLSDKIFSEAVLFGLSETVTARCEALQKYLAELFRDPHQNERMTGESREFKLLEFYTVYLNELISAQILLETRAFVKAELEEAMQNFPINHEMVFKHFSDLIDFLTRKKLIVPIQVSKQIIACIERLVDGERISPISKKYLLMVTALMSQVLKKPRSPEMSSSLFFLCGSISVLQSQLEDKGKVLFNSSELLPFLKVTRTALTELSDSCAQFPVYADQLPILESTLSKAESELYLSDWSASIIDRRDTVTFEELNLFSLYTCRLDGRLYKPEDLLLPKFKDKLILNERYFNSSHVIKSYIEILDIALSRYSHKLFNASISAADFTVFSLLLFYNEFLLKGIIEQGNIADRENLQVSLILTVAKCLRLPEITILLKFAMKCLLNSLIRVKGKGVFELNKFSKTKLPPATEFEIFHLMVQNLFRFSNGDLSLENHYFVILKYTYEHGILYKNKAFSKDQIAEIEKILSAPKELSGIFEAIAFE